MCDFRLSKDYTLSVEVCEKLRSWKDGITFWTWSCNLDLFRDDHKPSFEVRLEVLNHTLLGVEVYNVHHLSPEDEVSRSEARLD